MDVSEAGEAHPPLSIHDDVLDPVEFDLIDVLVDHALGDAQTLSGEFEGLATDGEVAPEHVEDRNDQADEGRREKDAPCDNPGSKKYGHTEGAGV